ncbi:MAG TPA: DNA gyrase inhibitor YacG [Terriglobales bacterium]|nr:DNA gyrase inhibitor YacG [Terriglobales bacterium]
MPRKRKLNLKCPTCKQPVTSRTQDFPFCSERCRLIDLGKWASGQYVISSPVKDISDELEIRNFPNSSDEE